MGISIENSWWFDGGLWQDVDLARVQNSRLHYRPAPIRPNECEPDAILTLRGPRRVGKTVALKLLIADLIESEKVAPRQAVWTTFEALRTLSQVEEMLLSISRDLAPRILVIDEVTAITGWQRVIKKLKDLGHFRDSTLILTGSSAYDLKAGAERMAGRRGLVQHPDRSLLPMSFRDFVAQFSRHGARSVEDLLELYFRCGGFPFRVEDAIKQKLSGSDYDARSQYHVFDDVFFYEIGRRRLERSIAIEVLARLNDIGTGAVSFESFAKRISVSRDTARRYLDAMGDAFLLATVSSFDTARNRVALKKDKKLLWVDTALSDFSHWLGHGVEAAVADRAEWVVGAELLRRYERRLWEGLSAPRNVFTWKSSGGNEIDYLIIDQARKMKLPVEVKYQTQIVDWDFQVMERAFGTGLLITRDDARIRAKSRAVPLREWLLSVEE